VTLINSTQNSFKHAVIDVGSNSVRLVIYQINANSFVPIHNEKVLAGLGRGIDETGYLSPIGVELAIDALKRFKLLIDALDIKSYDAIATAAARDAVDGEKFVKYVNDEIGLELKIISGANEGRLSALGVKYGAPNSNGIMGDLGGSSLELVDLDNIESARESWHLGPLALGDMALSRNFLQNLQALNFKIHSELDASFVVKAQHIEEFHAVGGAWRNFAQIAMWKQNYPLQVLQNYEMNAEFAIEIANWIMLQPKKIIEKIPGISQRRADTLPYAALLLIEIIKATNCKKILISSYGLREGLLQERFGKYVDEDPLISSAKTICSGKIEDIEFAKSLQEWINPILSIGQHNYFAERIETLVYAAALLSNIGLGLHPDHRAFLTYQSILRAPYPAASHIDRVFLARTIARRYGAKLDEVNNYECASLLNGDLMALADIIGAAMRLGTNLTSNSAKILKQTALINENSVFALVLPQHLANLKSESVRKRLDQLNTTIKKYSGVTNSEV
jgi:exopolyphosphatase / guanosine-5'-triphosphate,3'-diphosphate pyrophosphatase